MKIISISPYNFFQKDSGVNNRIYYVSQYLDKNYSTLHCIRDEKYNPNLSRDFKGEVLLGGKNKLTHILSISVIRKIYREKKRQENIIIYCHTLWGGIYGIFMNLFFNVSYIFDNHNVEYLRFKRTGKKYWRFIKLLEGKIIQKSEKTYVCSDVDKVYLEKSFKGLNNKIEVVENGVHIDKSLYEKQESIKNNIRAMYHIDERQKILLYSGSFSYTPNKEALLYIQTNLIPEIENEKLPFIFIICGSGYEKYQIKSDKIIYTGAVSNIGEYNLATDLVVAPLFSGSGTKLKIIEALGYGIKVLTTPIGAEGISNDTGMKVVNSISIQDIESCINEKKNLKIQHKYSWENILNKIKI